MASLLPRGLTPYQKLGEGGVLAPAWRPRAGRDPALKKAVDSYAVEGEPALASPTPSEQQQEQQSRKEQQSIADLEREQRRQEERRRWAGTLPGILRAATYYDPTSIDACVRCQGGVSAHRRAPAGCMLCADGCVAVWKAPEQDLGAVAARHREVIVRRCICPDCTRKPVGERKIGVAYVDTEVTRVDAGGPAYAAGVRKGHRVVRIDGRPMHTAEAVQAAFREGAEACRVEIIEVGFSERVGGAGAPVRFVTAVKEPQPTARGPLDCPVAPTSAASHIVSIEHVLLDEPPAPRPRSRELPKLGRLDRPIAGSGAAERKGGALAAPRAPPPSQQYRHASPLLLSGATAAFAAEQVRQRVQADRERAQQSPPRAIDHVPDADAPDFDEFMSSRLTGVGA